MGTRPRIGMYWACSCGGCDVAALDTGMRLVDLADRLDIAFWPFVMDAKRAAVEALPDGGLDLCLFNGAILNTEHLAMARLLRRKARILGAVGVCAQAGGVHGLFGACGGADAVLDAVYRAAPGLDNPGGVAPQPRCRVPEGTLSLPSLFDAAHCLDEAVAVDFTLPGCPPQPGALAELLEAWAAGEAPAAGLRDPGLDKALCHTCPRERRGAKVAAFARPQHAQPDPTLCLLEQGLPCMGPATRGGCGEACVRAGLPCRGCWGPAPGVRDMGGAMVGPLASVMAPADEAGARAAAESLVDPLGAYLFSNSASLIARRP